MVCVRDLESLMVTWGFNEFEMYFFSKTVTTVVEMRGIIRQKKHLKCLEYFNQ